MTKKILSMVLAAVLLFACSLTATAASEDYHYYGHWGLDTTRKVIFASDGGSYIRPVEQEKGTVLDLANYIPTKDGYIFDGWYFDPRTKQQKVEKVTLTENIVVYAKWIDDGTPKQSENTHEYASNEEIMQYGNYADEKTGVPVTALWKQQNDRLQYLMQLYNAKFNK